MKHYKVDEVIRSLQKKGVVITTEHQKNVKLNYIDYIKNRIERVNTDVPPFCIALNNATQLGNGSLGKIDFLTKYKGFSSGGFGTYSEILRLGLR